MEMSVSSLSSLEVEHLAEFGQTSRDANVTPIAIFILATYEDGLPPPKAEWFCKSLGDNAVDFRVSKGYLSKLNYTAFGLGNSLYLDNFNKVSARINRGVFLRMIINN
jgi:sulfite reductase alpha subunit-like flavoprotein